MVHRSVSCHQQSGSSNAFAAANNVQGVSAIHSLGSRLRVSHLFDMSNWYLKPHVGVGLEHLATDSYTKSGGGNVGLQVEGQSQTFVYLQSGIDVGTEFHLAGGALVRPKLGLGITYFVGDAKPQASARLVSTGVGVSGFTTATDLDRAWFNLGAAVDLFLRKNIAVRANVFGVISEHSTGYGGGLKLQIAF